MFKKIIIKIKNIFIISIILVAYSCSSIEQNFSGKSIKNNILDKIEKKSEAFMTYDNLLYVDIDSQKMFHLKKGTILKEYTISSSSYGTGSKKNSLKTPLGQHEIHKKIGNNLPKNAILKGRKWNGAIANIISEKIDTDYDHVTSRILWLDGLELGKNKGGDVDSRSRYIYIHGTAEEGLIGIPASDGCIRMYNNDVIELFDLVDVQTKVWIY